MGTRESYKWRSRFFGDLGRRLLSRRTFVASAFAGLLSAQKAEVSSFDFSLLDEWTVPNDLFFVRDHFPAPKVSCGAGASSEFMVVTGGIEVADGKKTERPATGVAAPGRVAAEVVGLAATAGQAPA